MNPITAIRIPHSGGWKLSAVVNATLIQYVYYGYTKREAMRLFRAKIKQRAKS